MTSTHNLKEKFEEEIRQQKEGKGKKEKVWTPHSDSSYNKQTAVKFSGVQGGPPPKKSLSQLP
ncbi:hypothetical protein RB653_007451 [Dictyostelium firmibasis]|uniref:Uncharacterized protein n=1 Tax=Dictyostelium firmibasis TaxID=79012 RepID=A0AAN7TWI2_9MYCE